MDNKSALRFKKRKPLFFLFFLVMVFGMTALVMFLWNAILPAVLGVKIISYWQAMGILALSRILFGSFGFGGRRMRSFNSNMYKEKLMNMTEAEKEQFKNEWDRRCC